MDDKSTLPSPSIQVLATYAHRAQGAAAREFKFDNPRAAGTLEAGFCLSFWIAEGQQMHDIGFEHVDGIHASGNEMRVPRDERRRRTDIVFREMAQAEHAARREKSERLKRARLENSADGV